MIGSILDSVKNHLGIGDASYTPFDDQILTAINSVFFQLNQLGVGPEEPFSIEDSKTTWAEFLCLTKDINAVKTYMDLKVRTIFDPPTNATLLNAMNEQIKELEWRLNVQVDPGKDEPDE